MDISLSRVSLHSLRADMLSALVGKLEASSKLAKEQGTKNMIKKMSAAAAVFNEAKTKEDTKDTTSTAKDYFTILKSRYTALHGCVTVGNNSGVASERKAAAAVMSKLPSTTSVFATKTDAIAKLEKVLTGLAAVPAEVFETISATRFIADMQKNLAEYHATMSKRVDVKVEKSKAAQKARLALITAVQDLLASIHYAQRCLDESETELVKAYNTVFSEIATTLKQSAAHKKTEEVS